MPKKDKLITDWKHWLGWAITVGGITAVFHFLGIHLHKPLYYLLILLLVIVVIDVFKHKLKLQ